MSLIQDSIAGLQQQVEMIPAPAALVGVDGAVISHNTPYVDMLGLDPDSLAERSLGESLHPDDIAHAHELMINSEVDVAVGPTTFRIRHADGHWIAASCVYRRDSRTGQVLIVAMDVSESQETTRRLMVQARTDPLTGAANRVGLVAAMAQSESNGDAWIVAALDLDRFKKINDTWGHHVGDRVLVSVAERLRLAVPYGSLVARVGGDEFVVLISSDSGMTIEQIGDGLTKAVSEPFVEGTLRIPLAGSVGLIHATPGASIDELLRGADCALYEVKRQPGTAWRLADSMSVSRQRALIELRNDLEQAVALGSFVAHLQPIVRLSDRMVVSYEAVARWNRANGDTLAATSFIDEAEDLGLSGVIGELVRSSAIGDFGSQSDDLTLAVNLSAMELVDGRLISQLSEVALRYGFPHERLVLEVTETAMGGDHASAHAVVAALRAEGFQVALDSFGSSDSTLAYVASLPLNQIKVDRSLIANRSASREAAATCDAVIDFALALDCPVVVKGVETEDQHDHLVSRGVILGQGWLYGRPAPMALWQ